MHTSAIFRVARSPALVQMISSNVDNETANSDDLGSGNSSVIPVYNSSQVVPIVVGMVRCRTAGGGLEDCPAMATDITVGPVFNSSSTACDFVLEEASFLSNA